MTLVRLTVDICWGEPEFQEFESDEGGVGSVLLIDLYQGFNLYG